MLLLIVLCTADCVHSPQIDSARHNPEHHYSCSVDICLDGLNSTLVLGIFGGCVYTMLTRAYKRVNILHDGVQAPEECLLVCGCVGRKELASVPLWWQTEHLRWRLPDKSPRFELILRKCLHTNLADTTVFTV